MQEDVDKGLLPFFVVATIGTPNVYSCDHLAEIGPVCCRFCAWLHVEASYAGAAFICSEFRPLMSGIEYSSSFTTSPHQWFPVNHECSILYVKEKRKFLNIVTDFRNTHSDDHFRNWTIPPSKRFPFINLWFAVQYYGTDGLKRYIWKDCCLAKHFEGLVNKDDRFQVINDVWVNK